MRFGPLDELKAGVEMSGYSLRALGESGRSSRERRLKVLISDGRSEDYLLGMLVFEGMGHYRP